MNEQQLADLFSIQIDRMLAGETASLTDELADLLGLGQQLATASFQPSAAAQVAFQGQLNSWFGPPVDSAAPPPTILGLSKGVWGAVSVAVMMMGAGLGLVALVGGIWAGVMLKNDDTLPALTVTAPPVWVTPTATAPAVMMPIPTQPPALTTPQLPLRPSLGDRLPVITAPVSDTLSLPSATLTSTTVVTSEIGGGSIPDVDNASTDDSDSDTPASGGDHDHGHGNDPDGVDEDNPGQSGGVGGGSTGGDDSQQNHAGGKGDGKGGGKKN